MALRGTDRQKLQDMMKDVDSGNRIFNVLDQLTESGDVISVGGGLTLSAGDLTLADGVDVATGTTTGTIIGTTTSQLVGFHGATPSDQASAYTQTYSTGNKTVAAPTATAPVTLTDSSGLSGSHDDTIAAMTVPSALQENGGAIGGTSDGNLTALVDPAGDAGASVIAGIRENATMINTIITLLGVMAQNISDLTQKVIELRTSVSALVDDDLDNRQTITSVIDDLQEKGLVG